MVILHIITGLATGGAERMLIKLIKETQHDVKHKVVVLKNKNLQGTVLEEIGIPVYELNINSAVSFLTGLKKLSSVIKKTKPDIIQGWMYHGNLAAILGKISSKQIPIIFNIRHSLHNIKHEKKPTRWVIKLNSIFSNNASAIIYNSNTSKKQHECFGFYSNNSVTIPNGFNTEVFKHNFDYRDDIRRELQITSDKFVFGQIGRNHPMKDYSNFVKAAKKVLKEEYKCHFIMVGRGVDDDLELQESVIEKEMNFSLLGQRTDIEKIWNAIDVGVLSSAWGEGFPNVVGEAMACEKPNIVTDVGDAAYVVGETGEVVRPKNCKELSVAMIKMLKLDKNVLRELGIKARERIVNNFSIEKVSKQYIDLYKNIIKNN